MKQALRVLKLTARQTRKQVFLDQVDKVLPSLALVELIAPFPGGHTGYPSPWLQPLLRIHFLQHWFTWSDPAMQGAFFDTPLCRKFAQLQERTRLPDASTILGFHYRLEKHKMASKILNIVDEVLIARGLLLSMGALANAALIAAPSLTEIKDGLHNPEMQSAQKGRRWHSDIEAHVGVDADTGLVHTMRGTSANIHDCVRWQCLAAWRGTSGFCGCWRLGCQQASRCQFKGAVARWHAPRPAHQAGQGQPTRRAGQQGRIPKGHSTNQGEALGQLPVWIRQCVLSRTEEKHGIARDAVRPFKSVDRSPLPSDTSSRCIAKSPW